MPKGIVVLTEPEIRRCVAMDREAIDIVGDGFTYLAEGEVTVPPIVRIDVPEHNGEVDVKTAYVGGLNSFAIKIASGFLQCFFAIHHAGTGHFPQFRYVCSFNISHFYCVFLY